MKVINRLYLIVATIFCITLSVGCSSSQIVYFDRLTPQITNTNISTNSLAIANNMIINDPNRILKKYNITSKDIEETTIVNLANAGIFQTLTLVDSNRFKETPKGTIIPNDSVYKIIGRVNAQNLLTLTEITVTENLQKTDLYIDTYTIQIKADNFNRRTTPQRQPINFTTELSVQSDYYDGFIKELIIEHIGQNIAANISPYWKSVGRVIYDDSNLSKGNKAFNKGDMNEARERWSEAYEKTNKESVRAKAALNIVYTYEVVDDITNALEWAKIAFENALIAEKVGKNEQDEIIITEKDELSSMAYMYYTLLETRKLELDKLEKQLNNK